MLYADTFLDVKIHSFESSILLERTSDYMIDFDTYFQIHCLLIDCSLKPSAVYSKVIMVRGCSYVYLPLVSTPCTQNREK